MTEILADHFVRGSSETDSFFSRIEVKDAFSIKFPKKMGILSRAYSKWQKQPAKSAGLDRK